MSFKSKKWTILLLILLIVFSVMVFLKFSLNPTYTKDFESKFLNLFSQNPFKKQSQTRVTLSDHKLNFKFDIAEQDSRKFSAFLSNLNSGKNKVQSVSISLDENAVDVLVPVLPADLNLQIGEKSIEFSNKSLGGLQNALVKNDINFSTMGGTLKAKFSDTTKYQIQIENPDRLVNHATSSGILTLSSKLEGLFKTLPEIATIELNVSGKALSGKIVLK
jgi:hypothetical protein